MPGEGERGGEGRENPEKDPFENFAEELERKQRESEGAHEPDQDVPDSDVTPSRQKPAESPEAEVRTKEDEFEDYAKELKEKYAEEEGDTDSPQVDQSSSGVEAEAASQERQVSTGSKEQTSDSQNQKSADSSAKQTTGSVSGDAPSDRVDTGGSIAEPNEEPKDPTDRSAAPIDPNVQNDSQQDEPHLGDTQDANSRPIETGPEKQWDLAGTNEQTPDNQKKEFANLDPQHTSDTANGDAPPKSADVGGYQQNPVNAPRDLVSNTSSGSEHSTDSPDHKRDSVKEEPNPTVAVEPRLDKQPGSAQSVETEVMRNKENVTKVPDKDAATNTETIQHQARMFDREHGRAKSEAPVPPPSPSNEVPEKELDPPGVPKAEPTPGRNPIGDRFEFKIKGNQSEKWVYISKACMKSTGLGSIADAQEKNVVVEIQARIRGEERTKRFFGLYHPESKTNFKLEFNKRDVKFGDSFEVISTRAHNVDSFVEEFRRDKPKSLENVDLVRDSRGLMMMKVDGGEYQIHNPRLSTHWRKGELSGKLMPAERTLRFWLDSERAFAMIGQNPIDRMSVSNHVLDVSYRHAFSNAKMHHFRFASVAEGRAAASPAFEGGRYFTIAIPKRLFRQSAGRMMEVGKEYVIQGRVQGVGEFKINHFESEKSARSSRVTLSVGKELHWKLKHGERYAIVIDSMAERRDFRMTGNRNEVKIHKTSVNSLGLNSRGKGQNEIAELRVRNLTRPDSATTRYFVPFKSDANGLITLRGVRGTKGDKVRFENPRRYVVRQFVSDFKTHKPENLKNVDLDLNKDHITMYVDGKRIVLREPQLLAYGLQAKLTSNIESTGRKIIFYFDGERVSSRLFRFHQIQSMRASDTGLEITYSKDRKESRTFLFRFDPFDKRVLDGNIKLVSRPNTEGGSYHFRASPGLRSYVASKLNRMQKDLGKYGHRAEKGNISEEIQHHLLSMIPGWEKVAEHPFNTSLKVDSARKTGPDSIYRLKKDGELNFVEFKWDNHTDDGLPSGSRQIRKYLTKYQEYNNERVRSGYVGVINWDVRSRDLFFYLRKVDSSRP